MNEDLKRKLLDFGEKAVKIGSEAAEVVVHLRQPSIVGMAAVAARALNTFNDMAAKPGAEYFKQWTYSPVGFNRVLLALAIQKGFVTQQDKSHRPGYGKIFAGRVYGVDVGWIDYDGYIAGPWRRSGDEEQLSRALGRLVWECMGPAVKLATDLHGDTLRPDLLTNSHPSKLGDEIYEDIKKFNDIGESRGILLYGKSGTGKSHIMRYVAKRAGGYSLRVKAKELSRLQDIVRAISLLQPSAVLIDDLDRIYGSGEILSEIEEVKGAAKIFMCSVNLIKKLDPAVLRSGRFDDWREVSRLDDGVLNRLIGDDVPEAISAQLRELPVAWIDEFNKRRRATSLEEALAAVQDLKARADLIEKMMGEDEKAEDEKAKKSSATPETI